MENKNLLTDLEIKEISIVPFGANDKTFLIVKGTENIENKNIWWLNKNKELTNMVDIDKDKIEKERLAKEIADKAITDEKNRVEKEAKDKLEKEAKDKIEKEASEKIAKEQKEAMAKAVAEKESLAKELLDMKAEVKKARDEAKVEKDARLLSIHKEFAKENLPMIGDHNELGVFLKEAKEVLTEKSYTFMETVLKSANEKIAKGGLFVEIGKDASQTASGNILEKINKMASDIMVAEKIEYDEAVAKVFEKDSKLYDEYEKQQNK